MREFDKIMRPNIYAEYRRKSNDAKRKLMLSLTTMSLVSAGIGGSQFIDSKVDIIENS